MRTLIADDDPVTCEMLRRRLEARIPHSVDVVRDGASALAKLEESGPYDVVLLDWMMPEVTGLDVCRRIRAVESEAQPYVALITAKNLREEILQGLAAGADDCFSKPIAMDVLVGRITAAARRVGNGQRNANLGDAICAAAEQGDGELVVASSDVSARIFFHSGHVAWILLSDHPDGLLDVLHDDAALSSEDIRAVIAECRRTGSRITDTLLAFGLVDRASLRVSLLRWMQRQAAAILSLPQARTLFLPKKRRYAEELLFTIDELFPQGLPSSERRASFASVAPGPKSGSASVRPLLPPGLDQSHNDIVDRCMQGEGVLGAAVLDRETGARLAQRGNVLNEDVIWTQLQSLNMMDRKETVAEVIIATTSHYHLLRVIEADRKHLAYVVAEARELTLAMLRLNVQAAISSSEALDATRAVPS